MWPHRVPFINSQWIEPTYVHHHNVVKPAVGTSGLVVSVCVFNSPPAATNHCFIFFCSTNTLLNFLRNSALQVLFGDSLDSHIVQFKRINKIFSRCARMAPKVQSFTPVHILRGAIPASGYWCDCKFPDTENLFFCRWPDSKDDPYGKCWFSRPRLVRYSHPGWISSTQCPARTALCSSLNMIISH